MRKKLISLTCLCSIGLIAACTESRLEAQETLAEQTITRFEADKAWEEFESYFNLFYAYSDKMDFDVEAALSVTKARSLKTNSKDTFRKELVKFGHLFADPHIIIGPLTDADFNVVPTSSDLRIRYKSGKYIVEDVRSAYPADKAEIRPGFVLQSVNQLPIDEAVSNMFSGLVDKPTARQRSHAATLIGNGKRAGDRELTFESGKTFKLENPRFFVKFKNTRPILTIAHKDEIAIIRINNALGNNDTIKAFDMAMQETAAAKGLVLDLRETPSGGNAEVGRSIIGHFVTEARPFQTHSVPSLEREFTVPRQFTEYVLPRAPFRSPTETVVLGSYWTGSMGEGIVIGLDAAADMHVVASDMGDLLGGLSNYNLKVSGIRLDMPSETISHVDGTPREDYVADMALISAERDVLGGDPALDAALSYLRSGQKTP